VYGSVRIEVKPQTAYSTRASTISPPAHAHDVYAAIIENPDLEVITSVGGERRKANEIGVNDVVKVKTQRSFFPMFLNAGTKGGGKE
jgi:hypothetical protein